MSKLSKQLSYYDLTGGINNVDTIERFNSSVRKTETPDMINVEYYKLGGIKSMDGNTQIGDKQDSAVVGGWEYTKGNTRYIVIALRTGELKIYNTVTDVFDKIYQFPNNSNRVSFCNMNNGVVATNGIDDPVFYEYNRRDELSGSVSISEGSSTVTGTSTVFKTELQIGDKIEIDSHYYKIESIDSDTTLTISRWFSEPEGTGAITSGSGLSVFLSDISQCNAVLTNSDPEIVDNEPIQIRGDAIQFYAGRLWIGGARGLFYSGVGLYNKWDVYTNDAGIIPEVYNDVSEVQALGLYSNFMLVHKKFNTYLLTMSSSSDTMQIQPYSNITCNSQQSWVVSNTKYFVYSRDNMDIFPLSQRTTFSDRYLGDAITQKVRNIFINLNDNETKDIFCVTLPRKRWMLFYLPMISGAGSNYALIYDFQTKSFLARQLPNNQNVTIAFNFSNNVYIGTNDGYVLKEFVGSTFNGQNIKAYYKSPWFDWADNYTQSFSEFVVSLSPDFNNNFKIRTFKDGGSEFEERVINDQSLISSGLIWDGGETVADYNIYINSFPVYRDGVVVDYNYKIVIPDLREDSVSDTTYNIDEDSYISLYREDNDLIVKKRNKTTNIETDFITLEDYYDGYDKIPHEIGNDTVWDMDVWTSGYFNSIRMLLPNNVFEQFQLEIYIDGEDNQGFAINGYAFRRIETDEAPW